MQVDGIQSGAPEAQPIEPALVHWGSSSLYRGRFGGVTDAYAGH